MKGTSQAMQITKTAKAQTVKITVPAGTIIGGGPYGMGVTLRETVTVDAVLHSTKGTPRMGDDWYSFEYHGWGVTVMADRVQVVTPEPTPEPTPSTPRTSRIQQQQERERAVWHSLRHEGTARYSELVEVFSVASTSTPGARYTITHDLVTGAIECNCPHGFHHGRGTCLHVQAVQRYLANRAAAINRAADEAVRARQAEADVRRDTSPLRRDNRSFVARFMR